MIIISNNFIFNFTNFCIKVSFLTKLLTLGIIFSTAVRTVVVATLVILGILLLRAAVVAKLVILDVSFLSSFILALRAAVIAKLVISGILTSMFLILILYASFLITSFFIASLSFLYQQKQILIYQHLIYLPYFLNCLN